MNEKQFTIEFDGNQYFLVIDEDNERCLARLDTMQDAHAWLEIYEMLSDEIEQLKQESFKTKEYYIIETANIFGDWLNNLIKDNKDLTKTFGFADRLIRYHCDEKGRKMWDKFNEQSWEEYKKRVGWNE